MSTQWNLKVQLADNNFTLSFTRPFNETKIINVLTKGWQLWNSIALASKKHIHFAVYPLKRTEEHLSPLKMNNDSKVTAQGLKVTHEPTEEVRSNRSMSLLWVPYVVLAVIMVLFFSVSFAHYHLKRRKYQLRRWASKCLREEMKNSSDEVSVQSGVPQVGDGLPNCNDSLRTIEDVKTLRGAVAKIDFKNDFTIDIRI